MVALIPLATGLLWLLGPADAGIVAFLLSVVPGALLVAGGAGTWLLPEDLRTARLAALGGALGTGLGVLALFTAGLGMGGLLILGSAASFVAAGRLALATGPALEDVPTTPPTLWLATRVAIDEATLGTQPLAQRLPAHATRQASDAEVREAVRLFRERGWLDQPESYHDAPPPLVEPTLDSARRGRVDYTHLRFESGYEPPAGVPGRERWLGYTPNRTAHAWVLRHAGEPRPWLMCIHGAGAGTPRVDLNAFGGLHRELGLNLLLPVLPLHGPRKIGRRSGAEFLETWALNLVHTEAQAMWDLRRLLSWVRAQEARAVGVFGLSLGGYTSALLASLDDDLACAIPGIPAADFARLLRRGATPRRALEIDPDRAFWDDLEAVYRVVSPLVLEPRVPHARRCIFAATADRFASPDHARDLWIHWGRPRIEWIPGGHLSAAFAPAVRRLLREFLGETLLAR